LKQAFKYAAIKLKIASMQQCEAVEPQYRCLYGAERKYTWNNEIKLRM
jgi:hypothetical protein